MHIYHPAQSIDSDALGVGRTDRIIRGNTLLPVSGRAVESSAMEFGKSGLPPIASQPTFKRNTKQTPVEKKKKKKSPSSGFRVRVCRDFNQSFAFSMFSSQSHA